jgi:glutamate-1-semialdehyde aminotransferase
MAAILGTNEVMDIAQETFISSTYWTERIGPTAALATIKKLDDEKVPSHLVKAGEAVQKGWRDKAEKHGLDIDVSGMMPLGHFSFKHKQPLILKTLLTQLMLEKGFLATVGFYASFAHKQDHVNKYLQAVDESFAFIAKTVKEGNPGKHLRGSVCHPGFKRLT